MQAWILLVLFGFVNSRWKRLETAPRQDGSQLYAQCPFDLDVLLYTGRRDVALLPYLFMSIEAFLCYQTFHIIVPAEEASQVKSVIPASLPNVLIHREHRPSWLLRLPRVWRIFHTVFWLDSFVRSPHVLFLDSDVVLAYPVTCADLFDSNGRPWTYVWPHRVWGSKEAVTYLTEGTWIGQFITYFPQVFPVALFPLARERFIAAFPQAAHNGGGFDQAYRAHAQTQGEFDPFTVLGTLGAKYAPEQLSIVYCDIISRMNVNDRCWGSIHVGVHIPYPWHACVYRDSRDCLDRNGNDPSFHKYAAIQGGFNPAAAAPDWTELRVPSEKFIRWAVEIMKAGLCFQGQHYATPKIVKIGRLVFARQPTLGCSVSESFNAHWRTFAYLEAFEQGHHRLQPERNRSRTTCTT